MHLYKCFRTYHIESCAYYEHDKKMQSLKTECSSEKPELERTVEEQGLRLQGGQAGVGPEERRRGARDHRRRAGRPGGASLRCA